jgi:hypothetical protein
LNIGEGGANAEGGDVAENDTVDARARVLGMAEAGTAASIEPLPVVVTGAVAADCADDFVWPEKLFRAD